MSNRIGPKWSGGPFFPLTKRTELETHKVPEDEVWKIESALGEITSQNVELIINDKSYLNQMTPWERFTVPQLPFYLPG